MVVAKVLTRESLSAVAQTNLGKHYLLDTLCCLNIEPGEITEQKNCIIRKRTRGKTKKVNCQIQETTQTKLRKKESEK